jgi:GxxExxY protein
MREPSAALDALASRVIGAAIEVHRVLGPGFLESVYEEALMLEFALRNIPFECQKKVVVEYKGHEIGEGRIDFVVDGVLVVELKAAERILPIHKAQVLSYLKTTRCRLGLLLNFHENLLREGLRRVVLS